MPTDADEPVYLLEQYQLDRLRMINKALFGDGSHLTPDQRRDLANLMHLLLGDISQQLYTPT
jgi:hypothetical protein